MIKYMFSILSRVCGVQPMLFGHHKSSVGLFFSVFLINLSDSAVYTVIYSQTDSSAIAKYRLWKGVGSVISYAVSAFLLQQKERVKNNFLVI